jgi:hypothetical protein
MQPAGWIFIISNITAVGCGKDLEKFGLPACLKRKNK